MLSPRQTCSRGVISQHNSEGASKLLINQNLRFQEKTLPVPLSCRVAVPSRALEGRYVLIITRGWPLFTPPIFHPLSLIRGTPSSFYERKSPRSRCSCSLIADRYTRIIANRRIPQSFERERVISSPSYQKSVDYSYGSIGSPPLFATSMLRYGYTHEYLMIEAE